MGNNKLLLKCISVVFNSVMAGKQTYMIMVFNTVEASSEKPFSLLRNTPMARQIKSNNRLIKF